MPFLKIKISDENILNVFFFSILSKYEYSNICNTIFRKRERQRERLCRMYNQILTECSQLNGSWPDPDDPRWSSGEYVELLSDWFPSNITNGTITGNATTLSTGNTQLNFSRCHYSYLVSHIYSKLLFIIKTSS